MVLDRKPRGYWGVVAALIGWLILTGAQQPSKQADAQHSAGQHEASRSQAAAPAPSPEPPYRPYAERYSDTCYNAQNHDTADLCAQWRAAIAAEKAADEARLATIAAIVGTVLSLATVVGLIITIWQTHGALAEARRGNRLNLLFERRSRREARKAETEQQRALEIAERNAETAAESNRMALERNRHELRAYLGIQSAIYNAMFGTITVAVENSGKTPARNVAATFQCNSAQASIPTKEEKFGLIDPGNGFSHVVDMGDSEKVNFQQFLNAGNDWFCSFEVRFDDVFGHSWCRKADFSANINHLKNGFEWSLYLVEGSSTEIQC